MRVILLKDVDKIGRKGEIREVADGYGRNFLLQNKLAELATDQAVKHLEFKKQQEQELKDIEQKKLQKFINSLQGVRAVIKAMASESGKLYGAVGKKEIIDALSGVYKMEHIILDQSIKQTGEYSVIIRVAPGIETKIKIIVESA